MISRDREVGEQGHVGQKVQSCYYVWQIRYRDLVHRMITIVNNTELYTEH